MYWYKLGYHIKAKMLCRIPPDHIPEGTVRVLNYRTKLRGYLYNPYEPNGELKSEYWSIWRAQDLERQLKSGRSIGNPWPKSPD